MLLTSPKQPSIWYRVTPPASAIALSNPLTIEARFDGRSDISPGFAQQSGQVRRSFNGGCERWAQGIAFAERRRLHRPYWLPCQPCIKRTLQPCSSRPGFGSDPISNLVFHWRRASGIYEFLCISLEPKLFISPSQSDGQPESLVDRKLVCASRPRFRIGIYAFVCNWRLQNLVNVWVRYQRAMPGSVI